MKTTQVRFGVVDVLYLAQNFLPTQTGMPIIIAGTAIPATKAIPTGAPTSVPSCHISFFLRDHGFVPQNVHPDGLNQVKILTINFDLVKVI